MNWLWGTNNAVPEPPCSIRRKSITNSRKSTKRIYINKTLQALVWTDCYADNYKVKCYVCNSNEITPFRHHIGHIIPLANGGSNKRDNLKPICDKCNLSMGAQDMEEFKESIQ